MGFAKDDVDRLMAETARRCAICGVLHSVQVHHIVPLKDGGTDDISNAIPLCPNCHSSVHASSAPGCTTRAYTKQELLLHLEMAKKRAIDLKKQDLLQSVSIHLETRALGGYEEVDLGPEHGAVFQKGCQFILTFSNATEIQAVIPSMLFRHEILSEDLINLRPRDKALFRGANVSDELFIRLMKNNFDGWWLIHDRHFMNDPHRLLSPNEPELFLSAGQPPLKYELDSGEVVTICGNIWAEYAALHSFFFEILVISEGKKTRFSTERLKILDDGKAR